MPDYATTTPDDVRRYVDTDLTDAEITTYIDEAEAEVLAYNAVDDFFTGELDRLVKYYTALLLGRVSDAAGGDMRQLSQGSRSVTLTVPGQNGRLWLARRVRANDPSEKVLGGRAVMRYISASPPADENEPPEDSQ